MKTIQKQIRICNLLLRLRTPKEILRMVKVITKHNLNITQTIHTLQSSQLLRIHLLL
jgi:hypothetical protein